MILDGLLICSSIAYILDPMEGYKFLDKEYHTLEELVSFLVSLNATDCEADCGLLMKDIFFKAWIRSLGYEIQLASWEVMFTFCREPCLRGCCFRHLHNSKVGFQVSFWPYASLLVWLAYKGRRQKKAACKASISRSNCTARIFSCCRGMVKKKK